jgi:hypothetical protein
MAIEMARQKVTLQRFESVGKNNFSKIQNETISPDTRLEKPRNFADLQKDVSAKLVAGVKNRRHINESFAAGLQLDLGEEQKLKQTLHSYEAMPGLTWANEKPVVKDPQEELQKIFKEFEKREVDRKIAQHLPSQTGEPSVGEVMLKKVQDVYAGTIAYVKEGISYLKKRYTQSLETPDISRVSSSGMGV